VREEEASALQRLEDIDREIAVRQELVNTYTRRNRQLEAEAKEIEDALAAVESDIDALRDDYQRRVIHAYKHGRAVYLAMILTAGSLDRILARIRYLRRFTQQRRGKVDNIRESAGSLDKRHEALEEAIRKNRELVAKDAEERARLAALREERDQFVREAQAQRTGIERELAERRSQAEALSSRIAELVTAESERVKEMTESNPIAAAEFAEIAEGFAAKQGALPWPVSGAVTEPFGTRVHPVYKTQTLNPGIEIATKPAAIVRSVFDGQVSRIFFLPGYGTCVTIRHGDYTSLYANFSDVRVTNNQRITAGQIIGEAGTEAEPRQSALFFALFSQSGDAVDPTTWLKPKD
jgi:septal ring factor EnvC (AmiA/AmiB activator)